MFGRATITLGIGPHSSFGFVLGLFWICFASFCFSSKSRFMCREVRYKPEAPQRPLQTWARGGQGGQPPTLEKIRVGDAHPGNTNRGLKTFRQ